MSLQPRRLLIVLLLGGSAVWAGASENDRQMPELVVDATPVSQGGAVLSYADALQPAQEAVVSVYSTKNVRSVVPLPRVGVPDRDSEQRGLGSGVVVSPDGYILTNNHVVEGADRIDVLLGDGRKLAATVIGTDPLTDIAVIKIEAADLPVITLADSDNLRVGDVVFAIGNPLEVGQTVTMGIVSAKGRHVGILDEVKGYEDFIQTDAAINMGNSGGALVDARGRLVGVNSAILSTNGSELGGSIGIGFAVPVNLATRIMRSLIETGTVVRGYLGISVDALPSDLLASYQLNPNTKGVVVTLVEADTPADRAGLKLDDVLVAVDGKSVTSRDELRVLIAQKSPDTVVQLKLFRDGEEKVVDVALGRLEDGSIRADEILPGVGVEAIDEEIRALLQLDDQLEGLLITRVETDSAYRSKLEEGMIINRINRDFVTDLESGREAIETGINRFYVYREGNLNLSIIGIEVK